MTLAVSEAVTNAIIHAFVGRERGRVALTAEAGEGCVLVRVLDDGRGMTPHPESPGLGLGLTMMASMATRCDIREGPAGLGTEVRLAFDTPGVTGPAFGIGEGDDRFELLLEVERIADGAGWPGEGPDQLVALIVPRVADACTLDIVDETGEPQRLAAHYEGPGGPELADYLAARRPTPEQIELTTAALRSGEPRVISIDTDSLRAIAHDDDEAKWLHTMDLAHWVNLPLQVADQLLGSLGLGLSPARTAPDEQLPFLQALAERAARGFANTQLISELRRTRERLERILGVLAEAVTVHDEQGKLVYANAAAVTLLGAASVEELLAAEPGELAARFIITREDGTPVQEADLPGQRLLAGEEAPTLLTRSVVRETGRVYWLLTKATRLDDAGTLAVNIIEDVTEAKTAERRQRFLADAGELLVSTRDYEQTLEHVADARGADARRLVRARPRRRGRATSSASRSSTTTPTSAASPTSCTSATRPGSAATRGSRPCCSTGARCSSPRSPTRCSRRSARDPEHLRLLLELGMRSAMLVALRVGDQTIGALSLVNSDSQRTFDETDLAFAEEVARRAAFAVDAARARR